MLWSDDKIATYIRHQKALPVERKRRSKAEKENYLDAVCTGPGSITVLSVEGVDVGVVDDSSSATGSASATDVDKIVDTKLAGFGRGLRVDWDSDWGIKFKAFSESMINAMSTRMDSLRYELYVNQGARSWGSSCRRTIFSFKFLLILRTTKVQVGLPQLEFTKAIYEIA